MTVEVLILLLHNVFTVISRNGGVIPYKHAALSVPYRIVSSIIPTYDSVVYYPWNDGKGIVY